MGDFIQRAVDFEIFVRLVKQILIDRADDGGSRVCALDEELLGPSVGVVEKQLAHCRFPVAASAAGFLIVGLDAAGHLVMNHKSNVGAVDAHAKRVGGHRHVGLAVNENFLRAFAFLVAHSAVIGHAFDAPARQSFRNGVHLLTSRAVDDAGLVRGDDSLHPLILLRRLVGGGDVQ